MGIIPVFFAVVNLSQPGMDTVSCIGGWGGKRGLRINYIYACARGAEEKTELLCSFPCFPLLLSACFTNHFLHCPSGRF